MKVLLSVNIAYTTIICAYSINIRSVVNHIIQKKIQFVHMYMKTYLKVFNGSRESEHVNRVMVENLEGFHMN